MVGPGHLDDDAILAFVVGQATDAEAAAINAHIDGCSDCRRVLADTARYHLETTLGGDPSGSGRPLLEGREPSRYTVLGVLGTGATGVVYAAFDTKLGRKVALKLLRTGSERSSTEADRLVHEAQAIAQLAHPNVVAVHDVGTLDGRVFIAMELVDGGALPAWLRAHRPSWRTIVRMFQELARGLAAAHRAGILHRDFKPENVLVGTDGRPRIVDFGLATVPDTDHLDVVVGTPAYMSPEQLRGERTTAAADQFSWAAACYEALYGESPFAGDTLQARTAEVCAGRVRRAPRSSSVPGWVRACLLRALSVSPAARHESLIAVAAELDRDPARTRARWIGAGVIALALVGTAAFAYHAASPTAPVWDAPAARARCGMLAQARCELRQKCSAGGQILRAFGDLATCVQRETVACTALMEASDTGDTMQTVRDCTDAYASLTCSDIFDNQLPAVCIPAGTRATGRSCAFGAQCASGYCSNNKTAACGTCANPPSLGADCARSSCTTGQSCDARTHRCVALEPAGAACDNNTQPCGFGLACVGNTSGALGLCTAETYHQGDSCNGLAAGRCDAHDNLQCAGASGARTCELASWAADGEPCGAQPSHYVGCRDGGNCYTASGAIVQAGTAGTCRAAAADGAACDTAAGPPCLAPARCIVAGSGTAGVCTVVTAAACDP